MGLQFERAFEYGIYYTLAKDPKISPPILDFTAPTTKEPGILKYEIAANNTLDISFNDTDITLSIQGAFGVGIGNFALKSASLWGPDEPGLNNRVELSFIRNSDQSLLVSDEGTRVNRARVRLSDPTLNWTTMSTASKSPQIFAQIGVANNFALPSTSPTKLGTLRIVVAYKTLS